MENATGNITIRVAALGEASLLARLGARLFAQAFAAANSPENMAAYLASAFSPELQTAELHSPGTVFLILSADEAPIGYAHLQVSDPPTCVSGTSAVQLVRFYVEAGWHGRGVSDSLMKSALAWAAGQGHDVVWLGVWQHNGRAVSFYGRWGFEVVGTKQFRLGSDLQADYVMRRALAQVAGA